jgi:hypothetical protein
MPLSKTRSSIRLGTLDVLGVFFCAVATLGNGVVMAFQGNGNFILSGFFLGSLLGLAWSSSLLFGLPFLARGGGDAVKAGVRVAGWCVAIILLVVILFHVWKP